MGRFLHLLLLIFSTHLGSAFAQESPIFYLTAQTQELYLKNFQIFLDSRGHFLPQKSASEFPDDNSAMWVRFDLQALENAPREWWLELNMPLVDDVILQTVNADGVIFSQQHFNYLDFPRAVDYRNAVFKLNLPQNARQTFYLKVQTQTSMPGSLHLWKPEVFQQKIKKDTLNYGIIIGLWIANLLILFFFSLISKNKIAALYFYLFAFYVFMLLSIFGYLQWLFLPQLTQYQILLSGIGILGAGAFSLYLSFYFLEIDKRLPFRRLSHHFLIFATLLYLCCFIALCIPEYHLIGRRVVQLFILLQLVLFTNVGFWITWRYRSVSAFIFTIGMLQPFLNSALYVLQNFGISLFTHFLNDSFYITVSVIANICLVDLGLFVFYADLNKKNQQTKQALQVVQQRITYEKQINEERFEFLRSLSHELRTPATLINMAVQNLRFLFAAAKPPDEDFLVTRLERIYNASERLNALLEENMSRYQFAFDSTEMDIKIHNTQDLIALIMEDLKKAELSPVKLKTQKLPVEIACDLALIRVSVRNLVQNAFKHSQRNELVQLEFKGLLRGGLRISVKDNGSGISKQHLPFIFDKFYRAQAQQQGSGLGLYLVKHIVTLHHGRIRAFSMQGRGTQIVIFLPAGKLKNFKR